MTRVKRRIGSIVVALMIGLSMFTASAVFAHNAGHIILPNGECHNVGSRKPGPYVGPNKEQLDLIPGPGDQFGARYAAEQGKTPILPGECP